VVDADGDTTKALSESVKEHAPCWLWQSFESGFHPGGARSASPDVVLMNIETPSLAALASVRSLKALLPAVPLIVLAGVLEPDYVAGFISAGASGCLLNPIAPEALASAIEGVLHHCPALCPEAQAALVAYLQRKSPAGSFEDLSWQERKVGQLLAQQLSTKEIATRLGISIGTIHVHLANMYKKMGVHSREEARRKLSGLG
jgi:DNA-binding NarL/FixJ family response regulator